MKNLPDKIYLNLGDMTEEEFNECDFKDLAEVTWSEGDVQGRNIEYVRKDVFIKKLVDWLKHNADYYPYTWFDETTEESGITDKCIEDLKKYMES